MSDTTKLESLVDWILTTISEIEEMGRDDPPADIATTEGYIKHTAPLRAANGRFVKKGDR